METTLGTILAVGFDFAPRGWALCNGQLLSIQSNNALYSLLGTTYGGDGKTTFGLPDLRGRTIVGAAPTAKTGVTPLGRGEKTGAPSATATVASAVKVTLTADNLPAVAAGAVQINGLTATSVLHAANAGPGATTPAPGALLANPGGGQNGANIYNVNTSATPSPTVALSDASVKTTIDGTATFTGTQIGTATPQPLDIAMAASLTMPLMQPSLGVNYIICLAGYYPMRS